MTRVLRALLTDLVDYAGLFPPAKLDMSPAAETYNRCRVGEHEWVLGRFVCPVARLPEFEKAASAFMPGTYATSGYREMADAGEAWRLSVLIEPGAEGDITAQLDAIDAFNQRHSREENGLAEIDMCEIKLPEVALVDTVLDQMPEGLFPFLEMPVTTDCRGFIASLAGSQAGAKIRTGGVVGNAFPTPAEVAAFLHACAAAEVPFKATAGLHHPVRGNYRLTYEKDSASCTMHGFLNLFLAAVLVKAKRIEPSMTEAILREEDPSDFSFGEEVVKWQGFMVEAAEIALVRETFALSFGSCSFDEPVDDLRRLGLLR